MTRTYEVRPSAARLIGSLRDIGYDFSTAIADLVDNAIEAGASHVQIDLRYQGAGSSVTILDDGEGMTESEINEALRFGSMRTYGEDDLGRYGLGLKTASLSQCRRLTVLSRRSTQRNRVAVRQLDLGRIERNRSMGGDRARTDWESRSCCPPAATRTGHSSRLGRP